MAVETTTSESLVEAITKEAEAKPKPEPEVIEVEAKVPPEEVKEEVKEPEKEAEPRKNKLESRFSEITEARRKAEERATAAEARSAELEAKYKPAEEVKDANARPDPKTYTDAFLYAEDLSKWTATKVLADHLQAEETAKRNKAHEAVQTTFKERVSAASEGIDDWIDLVASSKAAVSDPARDSIMESKYGGEIYRDLVVDDELAEKVTAMKPADQVKWIGRMEAKYEAEALIEAAKDEKPEKTEVIVRERPKAPAPIVPVRGSRAASPLERAEKAAADGDFKAYRAARLQTSK